MTYGVFGETLNLALSINMLYLNASVLVAQSSFTANHYFKIKSLIVKTIKLTPLLIVVVWCNTTTTVNSKFSSENYDNFCFVFFD